MGKMQDISIKESILTPCMTLIRWKRGRRGIICVCAARINHHSKPKHLHNALGYIPRTYLRSPTVSTSCVGFFRNRHARRLHNIYTKTIKGRSLSKFINSTELIGRGIPRLFSPIQWLVGPSLLCSLLSLLWPWAVAPQVGLGLA